MKYFIPISAAAAIAVGGFVQAEPVFSTPSGYTTQQISQGFNLIGITLLPSATASGAFTTISSNSVQDSSKNFTTLLSTTPGSLYILEITSGTNDGLIVEVGTWSGNQLNTMDNLSTAGVIVGDTYTLTKAPTLEELFGTTNSVLTKNNNSSLADIVWIPNGTGGYVRYFQNNSGAWRNAAGGSAANTPFVFLDGIFIEKELAGTVDLVFTGQVQIDSTRVSFIQGFNPIGTIFAAGSTLQNCGLGAVGALKRDNNSSLADLVYIPTTPGNYNRYFVNNSGAWRNAAGGAAPADLALTSGIFILRRDAGTVQVLLTRPPSYINL
jgi:hypothetical protein